MSPGLDKEEAFMLVGKASEQAEVVEWQGLVTQLRESSHTQKRPATP
jgi:hypothetical protein